MRWIGHSVTVQHYSLISLEIVNVAVDGLMSNGGWEVWCHSVVTLWLMQCKWWHTSHDNIVSSHNVDTDQQPLSLSLSPPRLMFDQGCGGVLLKGRGHHYNVIQSLTDVSRDHRVMSALIKYKWLRYMNITGHNYCLTLTLLANINISSTQPATPQSPTTTNTPITTNV